MRCLWCHRDWPEGFTRCPDCFSDLADPETLPAPTFRHAGTNAFARSSSVSVRRLAIGGSPVFVDPSGSIEANTRAAGGRVACVDLDGSELFRVERYEAAERAWSVFQPDGQPLATFLADGAAVLVRDGTGAPVASLQPDGPDAFDLVERGGPPMARCARADQPLGDWIDECWTLTTFTEPRALDRHALVAAPLVCWLLFARPPRRIAAP